MHEELMKVAVRCAEREGAHVVDMVVRGNKGTQVLELYIDSTEGVTTELCSSISREFSRAIDAEGLIVSPYRLEVSSPGIGRPLKYPWQYAKHIGRQLDLKVRTGSGVEARRGTLAAVRDTGIALTVGKQREPVEVPFTELVEARVKPPW